LKVFLQALATELLSQAPHHSSISLSWQFEERSDEIPARQRDCKWHLVRY